VVTVHAPGLAWLAWSVTALMSLALLLAPHPVRAAGPARVADLVGKWVADKNDPASDYVVAAGPSADTLLITAPAKSVGRPVAQTFTLQQVAPGEFATAKGAPVRVTFKVTSPRHASFHRLENNPKSFGITYILLEKP